MEISQNIGSFLADDESNPMSDVFSFKDDKESLTLRYDMSAPLAGLLLKIIDLPFPYKRYAYGDVFGERSLTVRDIDLSCNLMPY